MAVLCVCSKLVRSVNARSLNDVDCWKNRNDSVN